MQWQSHFVQSTADWIHCRHHNAGADVDGDVDAQASCPPQAATVVAAATDAAEATQASPRATPSSTGNPRSKADTRQRRKPWGSSMSLRLGSRGSIQSPEGSGSRDRAVGSCPPQRGLSQSSFRLRSGLSAVGSFLGSFHGGKGGSSSSEGCSPRHHAGRLPSFMDSTRSSQAHIHGQLPQAATVAESEQQGVHKEACRPSGVHIEISSDSDAKHSAEEGKSNQAQHAQNGHAELSPRSFASVATSSFMDSTQSSRAHRHSEEFERQHAQHGSRKNEESASELDMVRMHHSRDDVCNASTAGRRNEMIPDSVQNSTHYDVEQSLPQAIGHESPTSVVSVLGMGQGLADAKHFMQPTASSRAHTLGSPCTSIGKSVSMTNI